METTVAGPITVSFWWKVSSEINDQLRFSIDGVVQTNISGEVNWQFRTYNLGANNHALRWTYIKNAGVVGGQDRGWVDQVSFGLVAPTITTQPASRTINAGDNVTFSVGVAATPPLSYRWYWDGVPLSDGAGISGATSNTLSIANAQAGQSGNYSVIVSNAVGTATSSNAALTLDSGDDLERSPGQWAVDFHSRRHRRRNSGAASRASVAPGEMPRRPAP